MNCLRIAKCFEVFLCFVLVSQLPPLPPCLPLPAFSLRLVASGGSAYTALQYTPNISSITWFILEPSARCAFLYSSEFTLLNYRPKLDSLQPTVIRSLIDYELEASHLMATPRPF